MDELRNYLNTLEPGPVEETTHLRAPARRGLGRPRR